MPTTIGGRAVATTKSGHITLFVPVPSNIPPMPPPKPDGIPAPFPHTAKSDSADSPSTKLVIGGGNTVVKGNQLDVMPPGNKPSQPAPVHDYMTGKVNQKVTVG